MLLVSDDRARRQRIKSPSKSKALTDLQNKFQTIQVYYESPPDPTICRESYTSREG